MPVLQCRLTAGIKQTTCKVDTSAREMLQSRLSQQPLKTTPSVEVHVQEITPLLGPIAAVLDWPELRHATTQLLLAVLSAWHAGWAGRHGHNYASKTASHSYLDNSFPVTLSRQGPLDQLRKMQPESPESKHFTSTEDPDRASGSRP